MPCGQPSSAASIWPVWLQSSSMACLPRMTRPRLLPSSTTRLQDLGDGQRLDGWRRLLTRMPRSAPMASAVRIVSGGLGRADRDGDDLGRLALFLQPDRLFDGDLVEGVHRHLDVGEFDARAVRLDADLDVVVDHPLDGRPGPSCKAPRGAAVIPTSRTGANCRLRAVFCRRFSAHEATARYPRGDDCQLCGRLRAAPGQSRFRGGRASAMVPPSSDQR